jgi:hypothetical protein
MTINQPRRWTLYVSNSMSMSSSESPTSRADFLVASKTGARRSSPRAGWTHTVNKPANGLDPAAVLERL